jgi:hypothetical protein
VLASHCDSPLSLQAIFYGMLRIVLREEISIPCCQCCRIKEQFNHTEARRKLREYCHAGQVRTMQLLLNALLREPVAGQTLLDLGGSRGVSTRCSRLPSTRTLQPPTWPSPE